MYLQWVGESRYLQVLAHAQVFSSKAGNKLHHTEFHLSLVQLLAELLPTE